MQKISRQNRFQTDKISFAFWGTPEVASRTLEVLKDGGFLPSLIITSPDRRSGRGLKLRASPVADFAEQNKIPCLKPEKLDEEFASQLSTFNFQFSVVVAYGKIIPEGFLNSQKSGFINVHYSLLPQYRGASPVESAILAGERETGVTIQEIAHKLDSGPILAQEKVEIKDNETAPELKKRLTEIGAGLLLKILPNLTGGKIIPVPQDESGATYCKKITKEDGLLDLDGDPEDNYNKFRAYALWPRTFFFKNGKRVIVSKARLEGGKFVIEKVIPEGRKETDYALL